MKTVTASIQVRPSVKAHYVLWPEGPDRGPVNLWHLPAVEGGRQAEESAKTHRHEQRAEHCDHGSQCESPLGLDHVNLTCKAERVPQGSIHPPPPRKTLIQTGPLNRGPRSKVRGNPCFHPKYSPITSLEGNSLLWGENQARKILFLKSKRNHGPTQPRDLAKDSGSCGQQAQPTSVPEEVPEAGDRRSAQPHHGPTRGEIDVGKQDDVGGHEGNELGDANLLLEVHMDQALGPKAAVGAGVQKHQAGPQTVQEPGYKWGEGDALSLSVQRQFLEEGTSRASRLPLLRGRL